MTSQERRAKQKEELKKLIKETAKNLFENGGFENISMRKIADEISYTATTIYSYYANKEELLKDILNDYNQEFLAETELIKTSGKTSLEKLKDFLKLYIKQGLNNPPVFKLLTYLLETSKSTSTNNSYSFFTDLIYNCENDGYFLKGKTDLIAQSLWTQSFGLTYLITIRPQFKWVDKEILIETTINNTINGFLKK